MSAKENVEMVREIFSAIERRDAQRVLDFCHSDVELHWRGGGQLPGECQEHNRRVTDPTVENGAGNAS